MRRRSFHIPGISGAVFIAILSVALSFSSCSSCSSESESKKGSPRVVEQGKIDLSESLLTRVPSNIYGFLKWDGEHAAYERLLNSPWAGSGNIMSVMEGADSPVSRVSSVLAKVGLKPTDRETWRKVFSEAVVFLAPQLGADGAEVSGDPAIGVLFRSNEIELDAKVEQIKAGLNGEEYEITDSTIGDYKGFRLVSKETSGKKPLTLFFVCKGKTGILGSEQAVVEKVATSQGNKQLPDLVKSAQFERAIAGFPGDDKRFAIGYFDISSLLAQQAKAGAVPKEAQPLSGVAFALGMDNTPRTDVHLVYNAEKLEQDSWLKLSSFSASGRVVSGIPNKPLAFLSIDGQALKKLKKLAIDNAQGQPLPFVDQLAFLDQTKRLGLAARMAPLGQSILPLPDIMLVFESEDSATAMANIEKLVGSLVQGNPNMAGMKWVEKEVAGGAKIKSMMSPLGFGLFMASKDDLLFVASTENQVKGVFMDSKGFNSSFSSAANDVFTTQTSIGNLYLNFEEVGAFLENMGGLLSMYAPQSKEAGELLDPSNIKTLKQMGTMIGSVTSEEGIIRFQSFYEKKAS